MSYIVRRKLIGNNDFLQSLSRESGILYSQTLTYFWRLVRRKGIWLSEGSMQKIFMSKNLHAHSSDACVDAFYNALKSWREHKKSDPSANPPSAQKYFYQLTYKSNAIRLKNGNLILSNGRNNKPLILKNWGFGIPKICTLHWTGKQYEIICTYSQIYPNIDIKTEVPVGVDIGQINVLATSNGIICNGRYLRSLKQWRNKKLKDIQHKLKTKEKGSKQCKKLIRARNKLKSKVRHLENDILHKYTTGLVLTQKNMGVNTLVVGDLTNYRLDNNKGKTRNKENHEWSFGKITQLLKYKCEKHGLKFILQEESYTSQTCPQCGNRKKMKGREFICEECNFKGHRDIVGANSILRKYLGTFNNFQVVPEMTPGFSVRYKPNINVVCGFKDLRLQESTGF